MPVRMPACAHVRVIAVFAQRNTCAWQVGCLSSKSNQALHVSGMKWQALRNILVFATSFLLYIPYMFLMNNQIYILLMAISQDGMPLSKTKGRIRLNMTIFVGSARASRNRTPPKDSFTPILDLQSGTHPIHQGGDITSSEPAGSMGTAGSSGQPAAGKVGGGGWSGLGVEPPPREDEGERAQPGSQSPKILSPLAVAELASTPPCSFPVTSSSPFTSPCKPFSPPNEKIASGKGHSPPYPSPPVLS